LGRKAPGAYALELLDLFEKAHVATVSNLMLVHPYATVDSVARGIDYLESIPAGVFQTTRMMVYHGTRLYDQMRAQGKLVGNPLRYSYQLADPAVERFDDIFVRLRAESFWNHSIAFRTHDSYLALSLTRRLRPHAELSAIEQRLENVRRDVNRLYCESLRKALMMAQSGYGAWDATTLVAEARQASLRIEQELQRCEELLAGSLQPSKHLFSPMRAAAVNLVSFCVLGTTPAACSKSTDGSRAPDAQNTDVFWQPDAAALDAMPRDSAANDSAKSVDAKPQEASVSCSDAGLAAERQQVTDIVNREVPCFTGSIGFKKGSAPVASVSWLSDSNSGLIIDSCNSASPPLTDMKAAVESALASRDFPCLENGESSPFLVSYRASNYVSVAGGMRDDANAILKALKDTCQSPEQVRIVIDATGKVQDVIAEPPPYQSSIVSPEVLACVKTALQGLDFPCLAGLSVCPEYVIIE
jgi:hypothetical protein